MGNFNYLGKDWSDIVFEGRNKMYGAYKLREENIKNTAFALVFGIGGLGLIFGGSYLYGMNNSKERVIVIDTPLTPIDDTEIFKDKKKPIEKPFADETPKVNSEKQISSARTDVQENKALTEITATTDDKAKGKITAQDEFTDKINSGIADTEADTESGRLKIDGSATGLSKSGLEGKDTNSPEPTTTVNKEDDKVYVLKQNTAEPKEGFQRFYSNFAKKFSAQDLNTNTNEIVVKVKFVVEKDGSFTDIQIIDDKHGVGKEAERILKSMPKWKAASHNGKTVRSMFILPIKIQLK